MRRSFFIITAIGVLSREDMTQHHGTRTASWVRGVACLVLLGLCFGCQRAPGTARDQLIFISEEKEIAMGVEAFRQILKQAPLVEDPAITSLVNRVGKRIAVVANKPQYRWEFVVIRDDEAVNAFGLPGGKIVVFTGIFPVAKNEAGLAWVLGGMVAHSLLRHEDEADYTGLLLMAQAGYDPREAVGVLERMQRLEEKQPPGSVQQQASYPTRIKRLEGWLDEALTYYKPPPGLEVRDLPHVSTP